MELDRRSGVHPQTWSCCCRGSDPVPDHRLLDHRGSLRIPRPKICPLLWKRDRGTEPLERLGQFASDRTTAQHDPSSGSCVKLNTVSFVGIRRLGPGISAVADAPRWRSRRAETGAGCR